MTVEALSDEEWRALRLLRLLSTDRQEELSATFISALADELTNGKAVANETELQHEERVREFLLDAARQSEPVQDDIFAMLIDTGRIDSMRGERALRFLTGSTEGIDDVAAELCSSYLSLVNDDPWYATVKEFYADLDDDEQADEVFFQNMKYVACEWRERFLCSLEQAASDLKAKNEDR